MSRDAGQETAMEREAQKENVVKKLAASVVFKSGHHTPPPVRTTKNACRHCQMSPD